MRNLNYEVFLMKVRLLLFHSCHKPRDAFSFFRLAANDRGYAQLRSARDSLSQSEKVNAGANTAKYMSASR